jgi:dihydropteroate synthase
MAPLIMGILNVTPDSFSDGGDYCVPERAIRRALQMVKEGADIIDIGGESSRPGARPVDVAEELDRVLPVIKGIRSQSDVLISVDTRKSRVAYEAWEAKADWINDISAGEYDPEMFDVVVSTKARVVLMHMRGTPETMQQHTDYEDLIAEIGDYLGDRATILINKGADASQIVIDPGIGFAKTAEQNLEIMFKMRQFKKLGYPLLVGCSRKSFITKCLSDTTNDILEGSLACASQAIKEGADIIRVHDVKETTQVRQMMDELSIS